MQATEELKQEHRGIEVMLRVTEAVGKKLERGESVSGDHLLKIVEFFRIFADKCHHGKEEDCLFKMLQKPEASLLEKPIQVMLDEHKQGREHIAGMAQAARNYSDNPQKEGKEFACHAQGYVNLLREHIYKEDNILYPRADERLTDEEQKKLTEEFERIERERIGMGKHEEFHKLMKELEQIYLKA